MAAVASDDVSCYSLCPRRESFTVWLKPLIMQGNGCTVFNEDGEIVYRTDNYGTRPSRKVHLRDLRGRFIFTIIKRVRQIYQEEEVG